MESESTNKNNENIQNEDDNKNNSDNPIKCTFKKPTKQRNIRKRSDDLILNTSKNNDDDDEENEEKDKKKLKSKINQYTTKQDKKNDFSYDSSGNAGSSINSAELSSTLYMNEEEEFQKEVVLSRKNDSNNNDNDNNNSRNGNDDGIYRGMKSYSTFVEKKSDLSYKGGGVKAGPMKTSTTYKLSNRIDHQPDVCKDYKQTGQCTFGDACKFLHDRTDYKSGWQIDKEYEEEQKQKRLNNIKGINNDSSSSSTTSSSTSSSNNKNGSEDEQLPFACFICKKQYTDPVQTKCKHFFCEDCALTHNRKNKKCALCGEPTMGTFITPPKKIYDQLMEISKLHFKNQS
ncbi:hypothetical protein RB653_007701 [Dictyostelium firmibasis]|uniref:Zinc finger protein n=1 Tax=Dictyostelium firmibasis TaxID=79012 RepID=A0AAN7TM94_9MYCE